jgi:hypothetical protein
LSPVDDRNHETKNFILKCAAKVENPDMNQSQIGKELNYLQSILENFWANYPIHNSIDHVNLNEVFNDFKSGVKDITSFNSYSVFLRDLLHSLKDGHLY